jgi:hypothetical protein
MIEDGWVVMAKCGACAIVLNVDLKLISRIKGRGFSLWNKTAPCKRVGCGGVAHFIGNPPGLGRSHQIVLNAEWPGPRRYPPGRQGD